MEFPMDVAVLSATRTPIGRAIKGTLRHTRPESLAAVVMQEAIKRVPGLSPEMVEDVVLGCAMPEGEQGLNIARNAILLAGFPDTVAGVTVNRFCASGLQAIADAAMAIATKQMEVVIAGGVESMSMVPMGGNKISLHPELVEKRPETYISMGHTAERVASAYGITREMQDAFALQSHTRALAAQSKGYFQAEIVPVPARTFTNKGVAYTTFSADECPRVESTAEALAKLKPAFAAKGSVTAGNSSPLNDGAAALVLASPQVAAKHGSQVLGRFRAFATCGVDPALMGTGPIPAIRKLLRMTGLQIKDIDLVELNEAFAAQALVCVQELGFAPEKVNVSGGAIALGHPLGCTGARLATTLLYGLKRLQGRLGIVSMCIGGGMGAAGLFERTN